MARLASGAKLGYYPTPESVCHHIRMLLDIEDGVKALDPCCGDGTALELITAGAEVTRYGIELDQERYQKASEKLDHVLHGDALKEVEISGRFDLLFPSTFGPHGKLPKATDKDILSILQTLLHYLKNRFNNPRTIRFR